ncbi:MAG: hypothetical protein GX057_01280 [Clostridiales bacterium]|jgi:hypothetical protein|nr:hypothetical protein [Clostridiales bacterium]HOA85346.1 hypothetical protein [Bacillota bacterium]
MDTGLLLEILISVFAVFGACSLIKLLAETYLTGDKYAIAIICDPGTDPDEIGCLVNRARTSWYKRGETIVLLRGEVSLPAELEAALREGGVKIFRIMDYRARTYEEQDKNIE